MRYEDLRQRVCLANRGLVNAGLVILSFGNASGIDRDAGVFAIKPSGVDYALLRPEDIVVLDLASGAVVEGTGRPSSDTPTHRVLYQRFAAAGGIVHTHSLHATSWAQAQRPIPCFGTTHADHFRGAIPVTRLLTDAEIAAEYETNTGRVIVERFEQDGIDPVDMPACLDAAHGPFAWGSGPEQALENAVALEHVAAMAITTLTLRPAAPPIPDALREKHFTRKHGLAAYYGQPRETGDASSA